MAAASTPKTAVPPPDMSRGATADLCDVHYPDPVDVVVEPKVQIMQPLFRCSTSIIPNLFHYTDTKCEVFYDAVNDTRVTHGYVFRDYGGVLKFSGQAATVRCFENNPLVRSALEEEGKGRVLVVDTAASMRCAVLGDNLAAMGAKNGWSVCSPSRSHILALDFRGDVQSLL